MEFLAEEAPLEQDKESAKNPKDKKKACKNFMSNNDTGSSKADLLKANPEDRYKDLKKKR